MIELLTKSVVFTVGTNKVQVLLESLRFEGDPTKNYCKIVDTSTSSKDILPLPTTINDVVYNDIDELQAWLDSKISAL